MNYILYWNNQFLEEAGHSKGFHFRNMRLSFDYSHPINSRASMKFNWWYEDPIDDTRCMCFNTKELAKVMLL